MADKHRNICIYKYNNRKPKSLHFKNDKIVRLIIKMKDYETNRKTKRIPRDY